MPRTARLEIPGIPLHITHRGVNRCAVFIDDLDRGTYLHLLSKQFVAHQVALHAYVLMGNHVHLLVSSPIEHAISNAMRNAVTCYVRWFNRRHARTGTLWECRFKSCLVDSDRYLLSVIRYIELNPVRAGLVDNPVAWRWSSVRAHLGQCIDTRLRSHPVFLALGPDRSSRGACYVTLLMSTISEDELTVIRRHIRQQRVLGGVGFQSMVEQALERPAACRKPGRPRKCFA